MTRNLKNGLRKRLNLELELWYDTREEEFQDYLKISKPFHERVEKEHNSFINKSGIYLLISFLTKKNVKGGLIKTTLENHSIFTNDDGEELELFKSTIFLEYEAVREKFNTEFEEMVKYESKSMSKRQMDEYMKKKYSGNSDGEKYINMRKVLMRTPLITLQNKMHLVDPSIVYTVQDVDLKAGGQGNKKDLYLSLAPATVAAFLRVIYAAIRFSPKRDLRRKAIMDLRETENFKKMTLLCYKAGWTKGCIAFKFLKIVRCVIEDIDLSRSSDYHSKTKGKTKDNHTRKREPGIGELKANLYCFEIISKSIKEILLDHVTQSFSEKKIKSYSNCEEEIFLVGEITKCCKLILEKVTTFKLSITKPKILQMYEKMIDGLDIENLRGGLKELTESLPSKRIIEFLLEKLIPLNIINNLLRIKTIKFLPTQSSSKEEEDDSKDKTECYKFKDIEPKRNVFKDEFDLKFEEDKIEEAAKKDTDKNLSLKDIQIKRQLDAFVEDLKTLLGEYLSLKKESKFDIIEYVMKMKIFEGKKAEIKFVQEALMLTKQTNNLDTVYNKMKAGGMLLSQGIADEVPTETDQGITTKGETKTGETTKDNEETKTPNDTDTGIPQPPTEKKEEVFKFKENINFTIKQEGEKIDETKKRDCSLVISNYGIYILRMEKAQTKHARCSVLYSWYFAQISSCDDKTTKGGKKKLEIEVPQPEGFWSRVIGTMFTAKPQTTSGITKPAAGPKMMVYISSSTSNDTIIYRALDFIREDIGY